MGQHHWSDHSWQHGHHSYQSTHCGPCDYGYPSQGFGSGFSLIVVLFILLIIIGAGLWTVDG
ncbi:YjcZ family sporulation protein [Bacillus horti]|uniref:Uncharacterized protein (TIGR01732 family) n=1 Tax=Caldalkalibacillus horti TaxID=77523 RepID=A0ABT9VTS3_9BACI|nr:YjcZ family sporulation protein [Bacillus horti]MDQ0164386.1 uncharacterized protein (TIGR01732 family) [Bacillus horti]